MKRNSLFTLVLVLFCSALEAAELTSAWPADIERVWIGPEYWANRLQDWRIADGRLECVTSGGDRNVHLLTRQLGVGRGDFKMSVRLGSLVGRKLSDGWVGFRIGAKGNWNDYRDSVRRGKGLNAGVTTAGKLFIGAPNAAQQPARPLPLNDVELRVAAKQNGDDYKLVLSAHDAKSGEELAQIIRGKVAPNQLIGNLVLVCHATTGRGRRRGQSTGGNVRFWFTDWRVAGSKVEAHDEHAFGPILWAQHTLGAGVLKMTAMMPPIGETDAQSVRLQINKGDEWTTISEAGIDKLSRTAVFRIENWNASRDTSYRVAYALRRADGKVKDYFWDGTIRKDPVGKETIVVAAFTGNSDYAFPNNELVAHVKAHDPDVLFFSGDNIYENVGGYGAQRRPLDKACLDYLRKWYFFGWSFGELLRDRPCITIPDDHDVYQGNIWGAGGRPTKRVNAGGYVMAPEWVKMVERTQTSNLPDPYDPTPIEQGIGVYYTSMIYGRISFAIIEDRKFKSGPEGLVPKTKGRSDHVSDPNFDPKAADVPGAKLLGDRQLKFLKEWAADWRGADMKAALSQTTFCNVATLHGGGLKRIVADYDSNGWPQTGRNKAIHGFRRGFAFHICGDQHLATLVRHGVDNWNDACWAFCVPSICNFYPRAWAPLKPAHNWRKGMIEHTGELRDGFGNYITVWAHTNPRPMGKEPAWLHDKMPGYGIVRFNKRTRKITIECWPIFADPRDPKSGSQYEGWPKTISQLDNYGREAVEYLPTIKVMGMTDPVVQVIDESNNDVVYTLRIKGASFRPKVFKAGTYTVKVGEQGAPRMKTLRGVRSADTDVAKVIEVRF